MCGEQSLSPVVPASQTILSTSFLATLVPQCPLLGTVSPFILPPKPLGSSHPSLLAGLAKPGAASVPLRGCSLCLRCRSKQKMLCPCLGRTEGATSCLSLASQGRQWGSAPRLFLSPCSDQQNPTRAPRPSLHGANPSLFCNHSSWCARPCRSNEHSVL